MSNGEVARRPDYNPVRRTVGEGNSVRRIMNLRSEALIDQARIAAEVESERRQALERAKAAYDLAEYVAERSAAFTRKIVETGNDPELHQMHSYIKGGAAAAINDLMQGPPQGEGDQP
jgi:hypothetical protein